MMHNEHDNGLWLGWCLLAALIGGPVLMWLLFG
jgi:hypothetical protein